MSRQSGELQWFPAPAKVNLFLHVLGRRADGYHLLQTVFRLIERCDRVGLALRADGVLHRENPLPGVPVEVDLCLRAAQHLKAYAVAQCGIPAKRLGVHIELEKVVPLGGGLGGGSSDAATVLLVLNRMWELGLTRKTLERLALDLGADVPVFVRGQNAVGEGVGEQLRPITLPPAWYLVLVPGVEVPTKEIFAAPSLTRNTKQLKIPPFFPGLGRNDLEPVVSARYPEVARHLSWLRRHQTAARLSGSGACVFAEFSTEAEAQERLSSLPADMRGFVARGLERHPLHDWAD